MASRKISQREARQAKKQLYDLQRKYACLVEVYPSPGTLFREVACTDTNTEVLNTVVRLGFTVIGKWNGKTLKLYAVTP